MLDSTLHFDTTAEFTATLGGRALGAICSKLRPNKGVGYKTYIKLFHTGITLIFTLLCHMYIIQSNDLFIHLFVHSMYPSHNL